MTDLMSKPLTQDDAEAMAWGHAITSAVASDLLPPGFFDSGTMAPGPGDPSPDPWIQNGYVMLDRDWTGMPSHEDGWIPWFPEEMVWHHSQLRLLLALGSITPEIAQGIQAVAHLERACANAQGDGSRMRLLDGKRREALGHLDQHLATVVAANSLEETVQGIFELVATHDTARALRLPNPGLPTQQ